MLQDTNYLVLEKRLKELENKFKTDVCPYCGHTTILLHHNQISPMGGEPNGRRAFDECLVCGKKWEETTSVILVEIPPDERRLQKL